MTNSHVFPIVFATDNSYVPILEVAIHSLVCNARTPNITYKIYVLSQGLSEERRYKLARHVLINRQVEIEFIDVEEFDQLGFSVRENSFIPKAAYLRLLIPQIFTQYDHVLYIDCDTAIALDVYKFTQFNDLMTDHILAAVVDGKAVDDSRNNANRPQDFDERIANGEVVDETSYFGKDYIEQFLQLKSFTQYINSGVLYFNLAKIRELNLETKFVDCYYQLASERQLLADDQDCINYLCGQYGGVYYLDRKFNDVYWNYELALTFNKDIATAQAHLDQSVCVQTFGKSFAEWDQILTHEKFDCIHHFRSIPKPWDTFNWLYVIFWWAATSTMENYGDYLVNFHRKYNVVVDEQSLKYLNFLGNKFYSTKNLVPYSYQDLNI